MPRVTQAPQAASVPAGSVPDRPCPGGRLLSLPFGLRSSAAWSLATLLLSGVAIAACATAPSPPPRPSALTPSAAPSAIASPTPSATSAPTQVSASFPAATLRPPGTSVGWPYTVADGTREPVFGPDGTAYLLEGSADPQGRGRGWDRLVALDASGHVKPGWPIEAAPGSFLGLPAVGTGGIWQEHRADVRVVGRLLRRRRAGTLGRSG